MITAVDTNVIVALWSLDPTMNSQAQAALEIASSDYARTGIRGAAGLSGPEPGVPG